MKRYVVACAMFLLLITCWGISEAITAPVEAGQGVSHTGTLNGLPVGWHWYNVPPTPTKDKPPKAPRPELSTLSPTEQLKVMQFYSRTARVNAVLHPSDETLHTWVLWQNFWMKQASTFTRTWQSMLLNHPDIDYSVTHPHENGAAPIQAAKTNQAEDTAIKTLASKNGFFFFYRGKNALDQAMAPSLSEFATTYNIPLIAISVDGVTLPSFTSSQVDHGQAEALGIHQFPALLLINPTTRTITPVNYGFIAIDELKTRLHHIAQNWKVEE